MIEPYHFAIVTRDESWLLDRRFMMESRLIHGSADQQGNTIEARDDRDDELLALCDRESDRAREAIAPLREGRARAMISARRDGESTEVSATISLTVLDLSIVTTLPHLAADYESLLKLASVRAAADAGYRGVPLVWCNGSGAVLLHEAAGHPAEHAQQGLDWPSWLSAIDESERGVADLLRGEAPQAMRRESFRDVPLRRMTNIIVSCVAAGLSPPPHRTAIEILLVAGGRYEPLTDRVSLSISAANLIDGDQSVRLRPFVIDETRSDIARALRGAAGQVRRYPGVICSREGQELFVGSHAPDLVMEF